MADGCKAMVWFDGNEGACPVCSMGPCKRTFFLPVTEAQGAHAVPEGHAERAAVEAAKRGIPSPRELGTRGYGDRLHVMYGNPEEPSSREV